MKTFKHASWVYTKYPCVEIAEKKNSRIMEDLKELMNPDEINNVINISLLRFECLNEDVWKGSRIEFPRVHLKIIKNGFKHFD